MCRALIEAFDNLWLYDLKFPRFVEIETIIIVVDDLTSSCKTWANMAHMLGIVYGDILSSISYNRINSVPEIVGRFLKSHIIIYAPIL